MNLTSTHVLGRREWYVSKLLYGYPSCCVAVWLCGYHLGYIDIHPNKFFESGYRYLQVWQ